MFPSADTSACSPLPSGGYRGRSLRKPCGSPPSQVLRGRKTARPSFPVASGFPWRSVPPMVRRRWGSSPGFLGNPFGNMPRARDSGDPGATSHLSVVRVLPSALLTASASQRAEFSELNLHGLLPCCVRFAPTSRPVNGNTRFRPVCSTVTGRDLHPLDFIKKFHRFISVPPLPSFSQRDDNVGAVKHFVSVLLRALRRARHFALVEDVALPYQPRPARNQFQVRNSVRPMHLFGHAFDHDY